MRGVVNGTQSSSCEGKLPWLCVLSSVYVFPYFAKSHKKGKQFLVDVAKNLHTGRIQSFSKQPLEVAPWNVADFSDFFVLSTDHLHCHNDPRIIKKLLHLQADYILRQQKNLKQTALDVIESHLLKAITLIDAPVPCADTDLLGDAKKGIKLFQKYWHEFLDQCIYNATVSLPQMQHIDIGISDMFIISSKKYEDAASQWEQALRNELTLAQKNELKFTFLGWTAFKNSCGEDYKKAESFFSFWWKEDACGIKSVVLDYCARYTVGRYTDELERIEDKNYLPALTAVSSALFVIEEMTAFVAKILHSGPGVMVYPTANLGGGNNEKNSPFLILSKVMEQDSEFSNLMRLQHSTSNSQPYISYTYPQNKVKELPTAESTSPPTLEQELNRLQQEVSCLKQQMQEMDRLKQEVHDLREQISYIAQAASAGSVKPFISGLSMFAKTSNLQPNVQYMNKPTK